MPRTYLIFGDIEGKLAVAFSRKEMLTWYKSWFSWSGTLDLEGYAKHILAAFLFFLGFGLLSMALFWLVVGPMIALQAPVWLAWLPFPLVVPLWMLAIGSWMGILLASTTRFVRHLITTRGHLFGR